jgi:hypothetical protein
VTAAFRHRELVVGSSLAAFALIFTSLVLFEVPRSGFRTSSTCRLRLSR